MGRAQKRKLERKLAAQQVGRKVTGEQIIGGQFISNLDVAEHLPPDRLSWPVVRAYVPLRESWLATGHGTAGVIRRRPDGKWATAFFPISLLRSGITSMFGKNGEAPADREDMMTRMWDYIP